MPNVLRLALLLLLACVLLPCAGAEDSAPLNLPADAAPAEVTLPCTLEQVLYTALKNNATIDIARLDPDLAETAVTEAKGAFDPALTASVTRDTAHSPNIEVNTSAASGITVPTGFGDVADQLVLLDRALTAVQDPTRVTVETTQRTEVQGGLSQAFTTGTQLSLTSGVTGVDTTAADESFSSDLVLGLRQPLLRGLGRRIGRITIRQAQNQVQQSEQGFVATVLDTLRDAETAYWDLVLARELLKIREFGVTLAREQFERSDTRYRVGKGIEADVMAAKAELATREADLSDARDEIRARTLTLLQTIKPEGRGAWHVALDPADAPEVPGETLDEDASVSAALDHRPELKQAGLEIERRDLDVRRSKNDLLPNLDLVASYGRTGKNSSFGGSVGDFGSSRYDAYSVGVEFSTSLTKRSEKARLQRAKLNVEQASRSLRRAQDSIEAEARQAVIAARKLRQRIDADRTAIDARREQLKTEQARNEAGKVTTLDVLIVQRDLLQSELDEATARLGYLQALANLYAAEGTLLDRRGIHLAAGDE